MQVNLLAQLTAAPSTAPANHQDVAKEDKGFSKMLGDADAKNGSEQQKQSLSEQKAPAALSAQEVEPDQAAAAVVPADKATKLLAQAIGPEEAKVILAKLETMGEQGQFQDPAFDQLKEALEDIAAGGEGTDLGSMLEALPDVAELQPAERAPVLQRLLGWVASAIDKHKETLTASAMPDGTVQSLQASLFSTGDDAAIAAAQAQADANKKAADASAQAAAATATVAIIVPTAQTGTMPEWVKKLGEGEENIAAEAINEAIPSLALPEDEDIGLPAVNLPGSEEFAKIEPKFAARDFRELVEHAPVAKDHEQAPVVSVDANGIIAAPNAPSAHNTSSLTPITISAHAHLATHTAASEQVHVAITAMKKEDLNSITLQLEPADLGRVEIKMDTVDGKTNISFLVDKPETLDALSRDARSLERQLQEAGVRADAGSMQFNLRQQASQEFEGDEDGKGSRSIGGIEESAALEGAVTQHYTLNVREGVDIHA